MHFLSPSPKNKQTNKQKSTPQKNSLYFGKWNFLAVVLKMFIYFLMFQETETLKSFLWNMNLFMPPRQKKLHPEMDLSNSKINKFLIFPEMRPCTFQAKLKKQKYLPRENFLCFRKREPRKISYIFSKESWSYILRSGTLLYFRKGIFGTLVYSEPWHI